MKKRLSKKVRNFLSNNGRKGGKQRWVDKTAEEKSEHGRVMVKAREDKRKINNNK